MTDVPVYSECVIGYRQWKVADWVLAPAVTGSPWRPGVNHAKCCPPPQTFYFSAFTQETKPHTAPHETCPCGLYAMHEIPTERWDSDNAKYVVGAVAAWGNLQVHHDGFRAEYAQVVALADRDVKDAGDLKAIAEMYRVPLVPADMLTMEAERHGQSLPESIRPEKPKPVEMPSLVNQYYAALTTTSSAFTWQNPPVLSSALWTPDQEEEEPKKLGKRPSNRLGPYKPKRGPKNINPRKGR